MSEVCSKFNDVSDVVLVDLFCQQRNLCVSLLRKSKKDYFSYLKEKQITDNKRLWKKVKPFLSNKVQSSERINLTDKSDSLIIDCGKVATELNSFFSSVVKNLNIPSYEGCGDHLSDNIFRPTFEGYCKVEKPSKHSYKNLRA